ncbi:hypothetical protein Pla123a_36880 [Posidoniimonas polymericola]|uniref:PEP-CTERM protein-sorting domain-containing protein n=1 Tax=Posidoniimonas polymericola TaxID=2528002 RepID=A0A5C5YFE6_9BACT|nr:hypothetical protein [Posidoniimonas polymericola]TWT73794.1 hypothetical protein Pla123a_36880 [Posidoniimonas polymericola]
MKPSLAAGVCFVLSMTLGSGPASAAPIAWTDWVFSNFPVSATGQITVGAEVVQVTYTDGAGGASFIQTGPGTDFWLPDAPYLSTQVDNAPVGPDIVALFFGGTVSVNFSKPVVDPLIALVSWNNNVVEFGEPIEVLSSGPGYWGNGSFSVNGGGTGFTGVGELHGVIRLPGVHSSFSFTHTTEDWHGFTVGAVDIVPAPGAALLSLVPLAMLLRRQAGRSA